MQYLKTKYARRQLATTILLSTIMISIFGMIYASTYTDVKESKNRLVEFREITVDNEELQLWLAVTQMVLTIYPLLVLGLAIVLSWAILTVISMLIRWDDVVICRKCDQEINCKKEPRAIVDEKTYCLNCYQKLDDN